MAPSSSSASTARARRHACVASRHCRPDSLFPLESSSLIVPPSIRSKLLRVGLSLCSSLQSPHVRGIRLEKVCFDGAPSHNSLLIFPIAASVDVAVALLDTPGGHGALRAAHASAHLRTSSQRHQSGGMCPPHRCVGGGELQREPIAATPQHMRLRRAQTSADRLVVARDPELPASSG